jgi:hypothetical protein
MLKAAYCANRFVALSWAKLTRMMGNIRARPVAEISIALRLNKISTKDKRRM